MVDFANLVLTADTSGLKQGEIALASLASKGGKAEAAINASMTSIEKAAQSAGMATGKFGIIANQVGFQLQDVFASAPMIGWFRAIAQQAPQAAGAFSMLGGSIGAIVPWIGTAVAVGAALLPTFMNAADAAQTLQDRVDDLSGSVSNFREYAEHARGSSAELFAEFGVGAGRARELYDAMAMVERIKFEQGLRESIKGLRTELMGVTDLVAQWDEAMALPPYLREETILGAQFAVQGLNRQYGITMAQARGISDAMSALEMAKGPDAAAEAAKRLATQILAAHAAGAKLPPELLEAARLSAETGVEAQRMVAMLGGAVGTGSALASEFDRVASAIGYAAAMAGNLAAQLGAAVVAGAHQAERQLEVINAQIAAVKSGQSEIVAGKVRELDLDKAAYRAAMANAGMSAQLVEDSVRKNFEAREAVIYAEQELQATIKVRTEAERAAKAGGGKSKAAKETAKLAKELDSEAERWIDLLDPVAKYKRELAELALLQGRLSDGQMAEAVKRLNAEFADSLPLVGGLVDSLANGLVNGFKGSLSDIADTFKGWLAQMIATAAKNQIVIGLGFGGSVAGTAAMAGPAGGGMGGMLGGANMLGLGSVFSGASGLFSSLFGAGGGIGAAGTYLSSVLGTATTSLSAFGAAVGAVLPIVGIAALGISALVGKTKLLDSGIRVTVTEMDALIETFKKTEKSRLFGLIKSRSSSYTAADASVADPLKDAVAEIQNSILDAADVLGISQRAFKDFAAQIEISTKDMSEEDALQAVRDGLAGLGDDFAGMVDGIERFQQSGEGAMDAIMRLSSSLSAMQQSADTLGLTFDLVGLRGGDVASAIAEAFGGLDAMAQATQSYFRTFYSEGERVAIITRQTTEQLAKLGLTMPRSRDEYRRMIESLDLSQKSSAELYATLISLSVVMDEILPSVGSLTSQLAALLGTVKSEIDTLISSTTDAQKANEQAAANWYKASASIGDYIAKLRGTAGALVSAQRALAFNRAQYRQTLAAAKGGDLTAANNITSVAQTLLDSVRATARSRVEVARSEARVLSDLGLLQGVSDIEGARHDVIAGLLGQQVDLLTAVRDRLAAGGSLSAEQIDALNGQMGSLQSAIKAAEMINYKFLQERLAVSVDLIAKANVPADVKNLLASANTDIRSYVDFIARSNISADLKWLALTGASEHIATVQYLAQNKMGAGLTKIALDTTSTLRKTVNLLVGQELPHDVMQLALAGNSQLSRVVNATLSAKISPEAKKLALANAGAYSVSVMASLAPNVGDAVRRMVVAQQGTYAALITAAISSDLSDRARRILLRQQGAYTANITGVLAANMTDQVRHLLLRANTMAARAITVRAVFADDLTRDQRAALSVAAKTVMRTIRASINTAGLSATGTLFLAQIGAGNATVQKSVIGSVALGALTNDQRLVLRLVGGIVQRRADLTATGSITEDQRRLLAAVDGSVTREMRAKFDMDAVNTARRARLLDAANQRMTTTAAAAFDLSSLALGNADRRRKLLDAADLSFESKLFGVEDLKALTARGFKLLDGVSGSLMRKLIGTSDLGQIGVNGWTLLNAATATITRTINGVVNLDGLTDRQKALLDAIRGSTQGKLTLGGSFLFDPSASFKALFDAQSKAITGLTAPITALQGALGSLKDALTAETARQARAAKVAALNEYVGGLAKNAKGNPFVTADSAKKMASIIGLDTKGKNDWQIAKAVANWDSTDKLDAFAWDPVGKIQLQQKRAAAVADLVAAVNAVKAFDKATGGDLGLKGGPAVLGVKNGRLQYQADNVYGMKGDDYAKWKATFWADGGLEDQMFSADRAVAQIDKQIAAFASGGMHSGGLRVVGENGPELEATGPSRIYSASQTKSLLHRDETETVAVLRAVLAELAAARSENTQLLLKIEGYERQMARILRDWDTNGQPAERVA